jgi:hypothetical protein
MSREGFQINQRAHATARALPSHFKGEGQFVEDARDDSQEAASQRLLIVTPVFDDWVAFEELLRDIDRAPGLKGFRIEVVAVDDASVTEAPSAPFAGSYQRIESVEVIRLALNLGHQRAVAVGLCYAAKHADANYVVVMDSDGEDRPEDIAALIAEAEAQPGAIISAMRAKRSEGFTFRIAYAAYKRIFQVLTGAKIDFGNFCLIPRGRLDALTQNPATWNHLAAAIVRSRIPLRRVATRRGQRYAGKSSMNLVSLVAHGLSAISVYSDLVLVRVVLALLGFAAMTLAGIAGVLAIRLLTDLAIPGWASSVIGNLAIMLFQALLFSLISVFILLRSREAKLVFPAVDAWNYVRARRSLLG